MGKKHTRPRYPVEVGRLYHFIPIALACGQPQSSAIANTMFGRWFSAAVPIAAHPLHSRKQSKPQTIFFNIRTFPKAGFYLSGCEDTRQGRKFPLDNLIDLCR